MNNIYITAEALEQVKQKWPGAYYFLLDENLKEEKRMLEWELANFTRSEKRTNWIKARLQQLERKD